jgi:mitochondrial fission protein ELM1
LQQQLSSAPGDTVQADRTPRVWIVDAYRAGEQTQLRAIAEALGWSWQIKTLRYRKTEVRTNLFRRQNLRGVDLARSSSLHPPWPDLVLSAGMRNEPVCRWIRNQSGGGTRIVFVGRLWAAPRHFDLVITTPQYRVPDHPNVLRNDLPLHRVSPERTAEEARAWAPRLAHLPRPYIAVNMGGDSGPYAFGPRAARRLARDAAALAREKGGSLLVTSSPRTREAVIDIMAAQQEAPMYLHRWQRDAPENPYLAFLGLADELIVTADSISMLSEAYATGKPLHLFDLGVGHLSMRHDMYHRNPPNPLPGRDQPGDRTDFSPPALLYRALMRWCWKHLSRDISQVHRQLIETGKACWLGDTPPEQPTGGSTDMARALARIRGLFH